MKIITVLSGLFAEFYNLCPKLLKPTGKTVFLIFLMALCSTNIYSQSEDLSPTTTIKETKQKQQQDSIGVVKQKRHTEEEDTESEIQMRKIRERIERHKYWRGALIYTSIVLALALLASIFTLNYYQGKRKPK